MPWWIDSLLIATTFIIMLIWSWGTWPDPLIDFGRELYTPWQLSQGKVLYRDVQSFYGPLSPYVNAMWFTLFGANLRVLVLGNMAIMVALIWLLHCLLREIGGRLGGTVACLVFVILFGFAQFVGIGNYNYLCPYSHEAVHGLVLSFASMFFMWRFMHGFGARWAFGSGLALGLVFLTKPESFVACVPAIAIGMAIALNQAARAGKSWMTRTAAFAGAALIPPSAAFLLLSTAMHSGDALRGVLGSWPFLSDSRLTSLPFFRMGMGTNDPAANVITLLAQASIGLAVLAPITGVAVAVRWFKSATGMIAVGLFAAVGVALWLMTRTYVPSQLGRPLPLLAALIAIGSIVAFVRAHRGATLQPATVLRVCVSVFAVGLLLKMILAARVYHYGFVLAMPATMLVVVALLEWVPKWIERASGSGLIFRSGALAALGLMVIVHGRMMDRWWDQKSATLGRGGDQFRAYPMITAVLSKVMNAVAEMPDVHSMTVLPEGVMLNYLMRIPNPSPYLTFLPTDLIMFDERRILHSLQEHSPDAILLVNRSTKDYGSEWFGRDYALEIQRWIDEHYHLVDAIAEPGSANDRRFMINIMRRNPDAVATQPTIPASLH